MPFLDRVVRCVPERWLPMACCLPGFALAVVVGVSIAAAAPMLGLAAGTPALAGLVVMGVACPLTKLVAVLVFRRQLACGVPGRSAADQRAMLAALGAAADHSREQLVSLSAARTPGGVEPGDSGARAPQIIAKRPA